MGLIGNGRLNHKVRTRKFGGLTECLERQNYNLNDRARVFGQAGISYLAGIPRGYRPPGCWIMPEKPGGLASSNEAIITLSADDSLAVLGLPASGSSTITFTVDGTGGLIVSGSGTANITLTANGTILSVASGSGSATITFSPTGTLGAQAGIAGSASITISPTALIGAIGYLAGISTSETEFSAGALASAVWDALLADHAISGSMGAAMAAAGSAGDPWSTPLPGAYGAGTAGELLGSKVLTEDDLNKIADIILRRATSNVEASSDGDTLSMRSLYGMIAQGVHKTSISGTTLTVTKSDESTTLGTRTIATSPTAKPIISFDTD